MLVESSKSFPENTKTSVVPSDVQPIRDWSARHPDGSRMYPDRPESEVQFCSEMALALLLMNQVVFPSSIKDPDEPSKESTVLYVNCNDVFAWGCADAEPLPPSEIQNLYRLWQKDPGWAGIVWCMIQRREMPQEPVEKMLRESGNWDLSALKAEHGLRANYYDGVCHVTAELQYNAYYQWAVENYQTPVPWDEKWWDSWKEWTDAHPDWYDSAWIAREEAAIQEFIDKEGFETDSNPSVELSNGNQLPGPA